MIMRMVIGDGEVADDDGDGGSSYDGDADAVDGDG